MLEDDLRIKLKNTKPQYLAIFFHRRKVIRFTSEEDIQRFARFSLPESLDPPYDGRDARFGTSLIDARPRWFNVRLDKFAARIVRPGGSWGEVGAFVSKDEDAVRMFRTLEPAWTYLLDLQAISAGDVVEVVWSYMVPYDVNAERTQGWRAFEWPDNWTRTTSWRIFFHHVLPIRHQTVTLLYHAKHGVVIDGDVPYAATDRGNDRSVRWESNALPGCMDEENARPGLDLPHVRITVQPEDGRYWRRDRLSLMPYIQPYWLYVLRTREERSLWWRRVAQKTVPDHQNKLFNEFIDRTTLGLPGASMEARARALHNEIAAHFTYANDSLWYLDVDRKLPRFGDQVTQERIREMSRYDLYCKLLFAIGAEHATAYLLDRRVGALSDSWLTPLWDSDHLFGVQGGERIVWMHPKRSPAGLWAGELPFFWAGSRALIMNTDRQLADDAISPLLIELPKDEAGSTMRVVETRIESADAREGGHGEQKAYLAGQFSTLGRATYSEAPALGPVHPGYAAPPPPSDAQVSVWSVLTSDREAPYRFQARRELDGAKPARRGGDGAWTVDASTWACHAVPGPIDTIDRDLPFYWDTPQDDRIMVDLYFDRPMELTGPALERSASSAQATIHQSFTMVDPNHLRFESRLVITGEREEAGDAGHVDRLLRIASGRDFVAVLKPLEADP